MTHTKEKPTAVLLITCPDRQGLVATVADFVYAHHANILHADEHTDPDSNLFLMRLEWDLDGFDIAFAQFAQHFAPIADRFGMRWRVANPLTGRESPSSFRAWTTASRTCSIASP